MCWVLLSLVSRTAAYIILSRPLGNRRNFVSKKTFCKDETIYYIPSVRGESYRENIFLYTDISQVCGTRQKSEISLALSITLCTFSTDCIRHSPRREGGRSTSTWPLRVWLLGEIYSRSYRLLFRSSPSLSPLYSSTHTKSKYVTRYRPTTVLCIALPRNIYLKMCRRESSRKFSAVMGGPIILLCASVKLLRELHPPSVHQSTLYTA